MGRHCSHTRPSVHAMCTEYLRCAGWKASILFGIKLVVVGFEGGILLVMT